MLSPAEMEYTCEWFSLRAIFHSRNHQLLTFSAEIRSFPHGKEFTLNDCAAQYGLGKFALVLDSGKGLLSLTGQDGDPRVHSGSKHCQPPLMVSCRICTAQKKVPVISKGYENTNLRRKASNF